jgi:hypothetical protein
METPFIIRVEQKLLAGASDSNYEDLLEYLRKDAMQLLHKKISDGGEYTISSKEGKTICYSVDTPHVMLWVEIIIK